MEKMIRSMNIEHNQPELLVLRSLFFRFCALEGAIAQTHGQLSHLEEELLVSPFLQLFLVKFRRSSLMKTGNT